MSSLIQPILDKHFLALKEEREPDGFFHPSSLTGCARQAVYERTGTPKTDATDVRNVRIMARGTDMHEEIQGLMLQEFPGFLAEVPVEYGLVRGSCDGLLPMGDGVTLAESLTAPVYELQEFKSISPIAKKFKGSLPKPEHVMQARIYAWGLENTGYLIDGIRISYFDRDDWSVQEYEVQPWTDEEALVFENQLDDLEWHAQEGSLPERKEQGYWLCRYCSFRTRCWEQDGDYERHDQ